MKMGSMVTTDLHRQEITKAVEVKTDVLEQTAISLGENLKQLKEKSTKKLEEKKEESERGECQ